MALEDVGNYTEIHTNTTTNIITALGAGVPPLGILLGLFVNNPGATWQAILYDGPAANNIIIATWVSGTSPGLPYRVRVKNGLVVVTSGTTPGSLTVSWL
jgi:hypothetical protein